MPTKQTGQTGQFGQSGQDDRNTRVLFVDDETNILDSFKRTLRKRFDVVTASGPEVGLDIIRDHPLFAVVVSDYKMPTMNGVAFLSRVRELSPDTVRIMLTGHADVDASIAAVNDGAVFRFLTKPCQTETLIRSIEAAINHHQLVVGEKELLRGTLRGSVKVLTEILALTNPEAFGKAQRIKPYMGKLGFKLGRTDGWRLELIAMLSQIGCVSLPPDTLNKISRKERLSVEEEQLFAQHPSIGFDLLSNIPRLKDVAESVLLQDTPFHEAPDAPLAARMLKVLLDHDAFVQGGDSPLEAVQQMRKQRRIYDEQVLDALAALVTEQAPKQTRDVFAEELREGMELDEDLLTKDGNLVTAKGQTITAAMLARIRNFAAAFGLDEPVRIIANDDYE